MAIIAISDSTPFGVMNITQKNIFYISLVGILLLLALFFYLFSMGYRTGDFQNLAALTNSVKSLVWQPQALSGLPMRLEIPSIKVDTNIIQVGLVADGSVDVPKGPFEVGWYNLGPRPGEQGSSVIVGHYGIWQNGTHSVFDNLDKLKKGDKILVKNDQGSTISFAVREIKTYNPDDIVPDIFNKKDGTYLNLITCFGTWVPGKKTYNKRLVIFTEMIVL